MHNQFSLNGADPRKVELELLYDYSPNNYGELTVLVDWYKTEDNIDMGMPHQSEWYTKHVRLSTYIKRWKK